MDAATVTALGVLGSALMAGLAAMYGSRIAGRAQREGTAASMYNNVAQLLVAERNKAEEDQAKAEARADALELECARLRQMVRDLGGTP